MTTDTSREAVQALIARARDAEKCDLLQTFFPQAKPSDRLGTVMVDTLAALLDERNTLEDEVHDYDRLISNQGQLLTGVVNGLRGDPPELTWWSHHDAPELARAMKAKLDAVKAWVEAQKVDHTQHWHEAAPEFVPVTYRSREARDVAAILADTDEGKAGWMCSKCAREAVRGYDDGQIPEHHRTCSKRMPDTDEAKGYER